MFTRRSTTWLLMLSLVFAAGCGGGSSGGGGNPNDPPDPAFDAQNFGGGSATIDHEYFPLVPGTGWTYEGVTDDGDLETDVVRVSHLTRTLLGIECRTVVDRVYLNGLLIEETFDWYARDVDGNVWYMGEAVDDYEYDDNDDLIGITHGGAWEAGVDGAVAGILMKVTPTPGDSYYQEFYAGEAEDQSKVEALSVPVTLGDGSSWSCLKTLDWTDLEADSEEYKYYAPSVGLVREEKRDGSEPVELAGRSDDRTPVIDPADFVGSTVIDNPFLPLLPGTTWTYESEDGVETTVVEVLPETRPVMGIVCVVVRDRVWEDGLLVEDTRDWYAQDVHGNVWYFGEAVDNIEYDDNDVEIGRSHEGSWEAGVDGAQPGIIMLADPRIGDSYRQEYYAGEAEDIAAVVGKDVPVTLDDGSVAPCLQTLEWTPLTAGSHEHKYYAPGIGLVREEPVGGGGGVNLVDVTTN